MSSGRLAQRTKLLRRGLAAALSPIGTVLAAADMLPARTSFCIRCRNGGECDDGVEAGRISRLLVSRTVAAVLPSQTLQHFPIKVTPFGNYCDDPSCIAYVL